MTSTIGLRFSPCLGVAVKSLGDGAVVVNMVSGAYFELNRVGFEIWRLMVEGSTPELICETLADRYDVAAEVLGADVRVLLDALARQKLIELAA